MSVIAYAEALVVGALQGVTELFPVSSLGHSVLVPAVIGGSWVRDLNVATSARTKAALAPQSWIFTQVSL